MTLWVISVKMALAVERVALHLPSLMELAQGNLSSLVRMLGLPARHIGICVCVVASEAQSDVPLMATVNAQHAFYAF